MKKAIGAVCSSLLLAASFVPAHAADRGKMDERLNDAADVIQQVMSAPDKAIPRSILGGAHCVLVIPSIKKAAFMVGAEYGQGVGTCRTGHGWSAPVFVRISGASFGLQIGGQATDLVLVGMNQKSLQDMLHSKVKLGADASAAAGPVGRDAQAGTDWKLSAEFLTYSRSKGLFGGLDLNGDVLDSNDSDMKDQYGAGVSNDAILHGTVPVPENAKRFVSTVARYFVAAREH